MDSSQHNGWPFVPGCLSEIVDSDTLAVVESGCCERIGRPLTILDRAPQDGGFARVESIEEKQRYAGFCRLLRSQVPGGDQACKRADIEQARRSWQHYLDTGNPFRVFECHLGLLETTHIIHVRGNPVALLYCGQYRSPSGPAAVQEMVRRLGNGAWAHINPSDATRNELLALAEEIQPLPPDARERVEREVAHIQRIAEAEFERRKREAELAFLAELRQVARPGAADRTQLEQDLGQLLDMVRLFCRCTYLVLFGGTQPDQNVLAPLAEAGIPAEVARNLSHFNRRKAGLLATDWKGEAVAWPTLQGVEIGKGIRGQNADFFADAACAIPTSLGAQYHGVLVFGPFADQVDWQLEQPFLAEIAHAIGSVALAELATIGLEAERRRWQDTHNLLTHQLGTALTPITTKIGRAKVLAGGARGGLAPGRLGELLAEAEDLALLLAEGAKKTIRGSALLVERKDLLLERYPLSVLVENVASGFVQKAAAREIELIVEESVERLPHAVVDVARLTIALANLIENAVKYSHPGRAIYIRASLDAVSDAEHTMAVIEVDDLGYGIPSQEQEAIFEHGVRGLIAAKLGHIPGSGLGLWEARAVVAAHGGEITVRCRPTGVVTSAGRGHHVVFAVRIPLEQKGVR